MRCSASTPIASSSAAGADPEDAADFGAFELTFTAGAFRLVNTVGGETYDCSGSYSIEGSTVIVRIAPGPCGSGGQLFSAEFEVGAESLTLRDVEAPATIDEVLFGADPLGRG